MNGQSHLEEGSTIMSTIDVKGILQSCKLLMNQDNSVFVPVMDYEINNFSYKLCRTIQSYFGFVNRNVWKNY